VEALTADMSVMQRCSGMWLALTLLVARAEKEFVGMDPDEITDEQLRALHLKIDRDGSGGISMDEALQYSDLMRKQVASNDVMKVLENLDSNKDGAVSLEELHKDMEQWAHHYEDEHSAHVYPRSLEDEKFAVADADKNGLLDKEELPGLYYPELHAGVLDLTAKATIEHKDRDSDGFLTPHEFWEGHGDEKHGISPEEEADFKKLDKDGSGTLDLAELKVWESGHFHARQAFEKLMDVADKDRDGHATAAELVAAREAFKGTDGHYHLLEWVQHHEL